MAVTVKLPRIGNPPGLVLPKEVAEELHVSEGDTLEVVTDVSGAQSSPSSSCVCAVRKGFTSAPPIAAFALASAIVARLE